MSDVVRVESFGAPLKVEVVEDVKLVTIENGNGTRQHETTIRIEEPPEITLITVGIPGPVMPLRKLEFVLNTDLLQFEKTPGIISVSVPAGVNLLKTVTVLMFVDGRSMAVGRGWQISSTGLEVEVYIPVDPTERQRYLAAELDFSLNWH